MTDVTEQTKGREHVSADSSDNGGGAGLTIDEVARRTGMTARNIRAHQSRGLLPPPEVRGRTGYYDEEHVARLELIKELQADGFNLGSIARLLEGAGHQTGEVLRFTRALREPFQEEEPEIVDVRELSERTGSQDPALLERAERLGLISSLGKGRFEQLSPRMAEAGTELIRLGVSPDRGLDVVEALRRHADGAAKEFVNLFLEEIWQPFEDEGRPKERWPEVREALERLRPLAADSLLAMFQLVMTERVEKAFGRELERPGAGTAGKAARQARRARSKRRASRKK